MIRKMNILFLLLLLLTVKFVRLQTTTIDEHICDERFYQKPQCVDHLTHYTCECDIGMKWNGFRCASTALNSFLVFNNTQDVKYILLEKTFELLNGFTIGFWLKINFNRAYDSTPRTVFSYSFEEHINGLQFRIGFLKNETIKFEIEVLNDICITTINEKLNLTWMHIQIIWSSTDGELELHINGKYKSKCTEIAKQQQLGRAGTFILGQLYQNNRKNFEFNLNTSFIGSIYNFNIWNYKLHENIYMDCKLQLCGNIVQWSDFRQGIIGDIKIQWPINISSQDSCLNNQEKIENGCNEFCTNEMGPICRNDIEKNIEWTRTKSNHTIKQPCFTNSDTKYTYRHCNLENGDKAFWLAPNLTECLLKPIDSLKNEVNEFHSMDNVNEENILLYSKNLYNLSMLYTNKSIHDLSAIIDILFDLIDSQHQIIKRNFEIYMYVSVKYEETVDFFKIVISIIDELLDLNEDEIWDFSKPTGSEAYRLIKLMKELNLCIFDFQKLSHLNSLALYEIIDYRFQNIAFRQQFFSSNFQTSLTYPNNVKKTNKTLELSDKKNFKKIHDIINENKAEQKVYYGHVVINDYSIKIKPIDSYGLITVYYSKLDKLLPNHNKIFRPKDKNINSILFQLDFIKNGLMLNFNSDHFNFTFKKPFIIKFNYTNSFNISNTKCVKVGDGPNKRTPYEWLYDSCKFKNHNKETAVCECLTTGIFSITNDLYDPNWQPKIIENKPLILLSYMSCLFVFFCSISTFIGLVYHLRPCTVTTLVHKNFCISICLSQVFYLIGLTNYSYNEKLCTSFALINHYLVYTVFAWLMNETFNLYIKITYEAHCNDTINNEKNISSSKWKFYVLGWLMPFIYLIILFCIKSKTYFSNKICWFNVENMWLFVSPCIATVLIALLVMIFSAKQHYESSYTKNKKAIKVITTHTKAIWSQIILICAAWSFAFLSLVISDGLFQHLHAIINCLQGLFLFIFYFLLNDEIKKKIQKSKKNEIFSESLQNSDDESTSLDDHIDHVDLIFPNIINTKKFKTIDSHNRSVKFNENKNEKCESLMRTLTLDGIYTQTTTTTPTTMPQNGNIQNFRYKHRNGTNTNARQSMNKRDLKCATSKYSGEIKITVL